MSTVAPSANVEFLVNGQPVRVADAPNHQTLLDCLRDHGLTGAKEGCAEGECGACAMAMVVPHGSRSAYRPINSCLMLTRAAAGREFLTVEGLSAGGELCDAQRALAAAGGSQCGYCTPGFVISLFAEQYRPDRRGPCDPLSMAGNLCRCTGYRPIRDAALSLGPPQEGILRERLARSAHSLQPLQLEGFSRPATVEECVRLIAADPSARLVAGGTDLVVDANLKAHRFADLVSVEAIDELHAFVDGPSSVLIGAALPLTDIGQRWTAAPPAFREWLTLFASPPIRHRATLGGNLATASPIGDAAPLLLALDAMVHLEGSLGRRTVPLSEFFTGYRQTALRPGEMIVAVELPRPFPDTLRFYKVAKRRLDDISTVAAAFAFRDGGNGTARRVRLAFGGVAATPLRLTAGEIAADGAPARDMSRLVAPVVAKTLRPLSDHRGSAAYRLQVAASLVEKFAWECGR